MSNCLLSHLLLLEAQHLWEDDTNDIGSETNLLNGALNPKITLTLNSIVMNVYITKSRLR